MPTMKKKCLLDASSAILLYKGGLLNDLVKMYRVIVAKAVFDELAIPGYSGANDVIDLAENNSIIVVNNSLRINEDSGLSLLGKGERETIARCKEGGGDFVVVDDKKAARYCRDQSIPYINALLFVRILFYSNKFTHDQYINHMEKLINIGRYSPHVIDFAYNCESSDIDYFLPC